MLQLEAGECPDLEDVLKGLEDESVSRSDSAAKPVTVDGGGGIGGGVPRPGEDTDGGGVTTDQAHSSSESDSDVGTALVIVLNEKHWVEGKNNLILLFVVPMIEIIYSDYDVVLTF